MVKKRVFEKLYKDLFCIPKDEKLPDKVFRCRMLLSALAILVCTAVMAASTFALFYMDVSSQNSIIAGAYYSVTVDQTENGVYVCPLAYGDKHTFQIKADGTATTGYCKIQVGEQVYYTDYIRKGSSLSLTVAAAKDTVITFTPQWGSISDHLNVKPCGTEIIHSTTPYGVYKVEPNARLGDIADYYGVAEADILVYNGVTEITEGFELKIPGVSSDTTPYAVPAPEPPESSDEPAEDETAGETTEPPESSDEPAEDETTKAETTEPPAADDAGFDDGTGADQQSTEEQSTEVSQ